MSNLSAAFIYGDVMVKAEEPTRAEYVTVPMRHRQVEPEVAIAEWNILWETAQFRRYVFDLDELPKEMAKVAALGDSNVVFVPRTQSRYFEHAPLYHLLPHATVERSGLPIIRSGMWPFISSTEMRSNALSADFPTRFEAAWGSHIWRHLIPGTPASGFTKDDPFRLLAHNLDFWLPPVTDVMQDILTSSRQR